MLIDLAMSSALTFGMMIAVLILHRLTGLVPSLSLWRYEKRDLTLRRFAILALEMFIIISAGLLLLRWLWG